MRHPTILRIVGAAALALTLVAVSAAADESTTRMGAYWVVVESNRDGQSRGYSVRPDGTRLTPLVSAGRDVVPNAVSADGRTIVYHASRGTGLYVSRANGVGLRRIVSTASEIGGVALSHDGRQLAFTGRTRGIWIIGTNGRGLRRLTSGDMDLVPDWSPAGTALVYERNSQDAEGSDRSAIVVQPLRGRPRVVARASTDPNDETVGGPDWSPDGRWLAYYRGNPDVETTSIWLVRPDGTRRHRVPGGDGPLAWSPDGSRLAVAQARSVLIVGTDGRRLRELSFAQLGTATALSWSPDGRELVLAAPGPQGSHVWVVGSDGRGLRRVTGEGANGLVGAARVAPSLRPAQPIPPSERLLDAQTVATRGEVTALSADGGAVAFAVGPSRTDCDHVAVWTRGDGSLRRFVGVAPCSSRPPIRHVALAGTRVAWVSEETGGLCGPSSVDLYSATLADTAPLLLGDDACADYHLWGHGDLLVFNDGGRLVRVGAGREKCLEDRTSAQLCATLRRGAHTCCAASVAEGLIAIQEPEAVAIVDARGALVRVFPFAPADVSAARLDGGRLVVWRFGVIEVYDVSTGVRVLSRPMPVGYRLVDVDGGIAVLLQGNRVQLLRLADGRSLTLAPGREPALADLEPTGLYNSYATPDGGGRLAFVPRTELDRALEGGAR